MFDDDGQVRSDTDALEQVILGVAHELNNPNACIRLAATNLRELLALLSPSLREYAARDLHKSIGPYSVTDIEARLDEQIGAVFSASLRIHTIAERLKDATSSAATSLKSVSMTDVVTAGVEAHRFLFNDCGNITCQCHEPSRCHVLGFRLQLEQALSILITNARDAIVERRNMENGRRGTVVINLQRDGDSVVLSIADDGCGMSRETQERAFELYFTTKEMGAGDGLGLPLCRSILARHGGTIEMRSATKRGTTVTLRLPAGGDNHGF